MKTINKTSRLTAVLLILGILLPPVNPAHALRGLNSSESPPTLDLLKAGMEEDPITVVQANAPMGVLTLSHQPGGKALFWASGHKRTGVEGPRQIHGYDLSSGKEFSIPTDHTREIHQLAFRADGDLLASLDFDGNLLLWSVEDLSSADPLRLLDRVILPEPLGRVEDFQQVAFSPDGRVLAVGSTYGRIFLFELRDGKARETVRIEGVEGQPPGLHESLTALAFHPKENLLVAAHRNGSIRTWDPGTGWLQAAFTHDRGCDAMALSPDGETLATSGYDFQVRLWDLQSGKITRTLDGHWDTVYNLAFSPDGRLLASGGKDGTLRVTDLHWQAPGAPQLVRHPRHRPRWVHHGDLLQPGWTDAGGELRARAEAV